MKVLDNHGHDLPPLAAIDIQKDRLEVTFSRPVTREQFYSIFGNVGFVVTDFTGNSISDYQIKAAEIVEFSLSP